MVNVELGSESGGRGEYLQLGYGDGAYVTVTRTGEVIVWDKLNGRLGRASGVQAWRILPEVRTVGSVTEVMADLLGFLPEEMRATLTDEKLVTLVCGYLNSGTIGLAGFDLVSV